MNIIQSSDFSPQLKKVSFPVRYLGGANDIVVPVRREIATLSAHLPTHCDFQSELLRGAPHAMIASHPEETSERISQWVSEIEAKNTVDISTALLSPDSPRAEWRSDAETAK